MAAGSRSSLTVAQTTDATGRPVVDRTVQSEQAFKRINVTHFSAYVDSSAETDCELATSSAGAFASWMSAKIPQLYKSADTSDAASGKMFGILPVDADIRMCIRNARQNSNPIFDLNCDLSPVRIQLRRQEVSHAQLHRRSTMASFHNLRDVGFWRAIDAAVALHVWWPLGMLLTNCTL